MRDIKRTSYKEVCHAAWSADVDQGRLVTRVGQINDSVNRLARAPQFADFYPDYSQSLNSAPQEGTTE
jgi:hypothetical protein